MNIEDLIEKEDKLSSTIATLETAISSIEYRKEKNVTFNCSLILKSPIEIKVFINNFFRDVKVNPDLLLSALNEQLNLVQAEREPLKKKIEAINLMLESN